MAIRILIFAIMLSAASGLFAQGIPAINPDRPDQTEGPTTLPKNHFQMESGFSFEQTDSETKTYAHPSILFKYGLNGRFDFRLSMEFLTVKDSAGNATGFNPVAVGF